MNYIQSASSYSRSLWNMAAPLATRRNLVVGAVALTAVYAVSKLYSSYMHPQPAVVPPVPEQPAPQSPKIAGLENGRGAPAPDLEQPVIPLPLVVVQPEVVAPLVHPQPLDIEAPREPVAALPPSDLEQPVIPQPLVVVQPEVVAPLVHPQPLDIEAPREPVAVLPPSDLEQPVVNPNSPKIDANDDDEKEEDFELLDLPPVEKPRTQESFFNTVKSAYVNTFGFPAWNEPISDEAATAFFQSLKPKSFAELKNKGNFSHTTFERNRYLTQAQEFHKTFEKTLIDQPHDDFLREREAAIQEKRPLRYKVPYETTSKAIDNVSDKKKVGCFIDKALKEKISNSFRKDNKWDIPKLMKQIERDLPDMSIVINEKRCKNLVELEQIFKPITDDQNKKNMFTILPFLQQNVQTDVMSTLLFLEREENDVRLTQSGGEFEMTSNGMEVTKYPSRVYANCYKNGWELQAEQDLLLQDFGDGKSYPITTKTLIRSDQPEAEIWWSFE